LEYRRYDNRTPDARRAARADPWCFAAIHRRVQTPVAEALERIAAGHGVELPDAALPLAVAAGAMQIGLALERLLAHAREHSAFYRERIPAGPVSLERVPPLEKAEMMARYDDIVTDPRLRRDELLRWIETRRRDEYYAGRHGPESCRRWSG
jgi:hypothetical protein